MPPVEELPPPRAKRRHDVLEVRRRRGRRAECRRIERPAANGKQRQADEAARNLEAPVRDVFVRHAVGKQMKRNPEQERAEARTRGSAGRTAACDVHGDDHDYFLPAMNETRASSCVFVSFLPKFFGITFG